jgi:thiol-disulfide isomerase/thioredoxin
MKASLLILTAFALVCVPRAYAKRAPNLELTDPAGKTQKISDLRGSIAVVNFWATWCVPCREELPMLTRLSKEYGEKKVRFVAVSADERKNRAAVEKFVAANQLRWRFGWAPISICSSAPISGMSCPRPSSSTNRATWWRACLDKRAKRTSASLWTGSSAERKTQRRQQS